MCQFCSEHGEGKLWYLNANNYATELLADLERRHFIEHFYHRVIVKGNREVSLLEKGFFKRLGIPAAIKAKVVRESKKNHFGQVLPLEDVERVLAMAQTITRVACGCRWAKEKKESRLCYGITTGVPAWTDFINMDFFGSPDLARFETLDRDQALENIRSADQQGYVHSVWTFGTPFIGAICNCEPAYCLALRTTVGLGLTSMFRAEYVADVVEGVCTGCGACLEQCHFNALSYDDNGCCRIDREKCYGCGVCRAVCPTDAIQLHERRLDNVASRLWE
jgi:ferredoxin